MSRPDLDNSNTRFDNDESAREESAYSEKSSQSASVERTGKWANLGRPLFWNGLSRATFGGTLLILTIVGIFLSYHRSVEAGSQSLEIAKKKVLEGLDNNININVKPNVLDQPKALTEPSPRKILDFCFTGIIALTSTGIGLSYLFSGLKMILQPVYVPSNAPGGIDGLRGYVLPILEELPGDDLYLGTYDIPTGLVSLITHAVAPDHSFFTRPLHPIVAAANRLTILFVLSFVCLCFIQKEGGGWGLILIPASLLATIPVVSAALMSTGPRRPCSPQIIQNSLTRVDVGNPMSLYEFLRHEGLDKFRNFAENKSRSDRMACDDGDTGKKRAAIKFDWYVCLESEPILVQGNAQFPLAASILEVAGVVFGIVGGVSLLVLPVEEFWGLKLAGIIQLLLTMWFLGVAYTIRNTYRWKSDLIAVTAEGTMQRQRTGGEETGYTIDRIQSQMHLTVLGTSLISECTTPGIYKIPSKNLDSGKALKDLRSALSSPRYLIETCVDSTFQTKANAVVQLLERFHDREGVVMGAEEDSAGAVSLQENKKKRRQEELMLENQASLQKQMQMMLFGKVIENMTPDQLQEMMLKGAAMAPQAEPDQRVPVVAPLPEEQVKSRATEVRAAPVPALLPNQIPPDIENQLKNAYRDYYRTYLDPKFGEPDRAEKLKAVKLLMLRYKISRDQVVMIEKGIRAEIGIKPKP